MDTHSPTTTLEREPLFCFHIDINELRLILPVVKIHRDGIIWTLLPLASLVQSDVARFIHVLVLFLSLRSLPLNENVTTSFWIFINLSMRTGGCASYELRLYGHPCTNPLGKCVQLWASGC